MGIDWGLGVAVMLSGLLVVFTLLLVLVLICWGMGKAFRAMARRKQGGPRPEKPAKKPAEPLWIAPLPDAALPEAGPDDELVAVIAGAVACVLGPDRPFAFRAIRRAGRLGRAGRDAWSAAGIAESTRPF